MPRGIPIKNLQGQIFNKLKVISISDKHSSAGKIWNCLCECGKETTATSTELVNEKKKSCGCSRTDANIDRLSGETFGEFYVIEDVGSSNYGRLYVCQCSCGMKLEMSSSHLKQIGKGSRKIHCGCKEVVRIKPTTAKRYTHKMTGSPTYNTWSNMVQRTTNENRWDYVHYGARGINVSEQWLRFENFFEDMGEKPEGMSLERLKLDEGYCKENCVWADETTQNYHQRVRKDSKSGVAGVTMNKSGAWLARLWKDGKLVHYSRHQSFESAVEARETSEIEHYGYEKSR